MRNHKYNCGSRGKKKFHTKICCDKLLLSNSSMSKGQFFILKSKDKDIHFYVYTYTYLQIGNSYFHLNPKISNF